MEKVHVHYVPGLFKVFHKSFYFIFSSCLFLTGPRGPPGRDGKTHKTDVALHQ